MPEKIPVYNIAHGGPMSRTEIGQDKRGASYINRKIGKDLVVLKSAHDEWKGLKQRVRNELTVRDISTDGSGDQTEDGIHLSVNIAHRYGVPRLRLAMRHYLGKYGSSVATLTRLKQQRRRDNQKTKKAENDKQYYGRKLEHLKEFDAIAEQMFSRTSKAKENLLGLSGKVFANVNPNLHDDMLLAKENKLLSVNAHRRKDESCGLVNRQKSRRLIRQIVVSALLHHGYATAKTLKQELTKACELADRAGIRSGLSKYVEGRLSQIMENINNGALAADAVLKDVELRNVAALAEEKLTERFQEICGDVGGYFRRRFIEQAIIRVAAKGGLNAAHNFLELLKNKEWQERRDLVNNTMDALKDATAKEPHYMYVPFNPQSGGIDGNLEEGLKKYREKPHFTIIDRGKPANLLEKPLGDVDPHHVVLIQGHGNYGVDAVTAVGKKKKLDKMLPQTKNEAALNADRLAERLEQDGLAKNHKVIRLLTCYGGGDLRYERNVIGVQLQSNLYDDAFAKRLAVALKNRGYGNIIVGGYPGSVHPGNFREHKLVTARDDYEATNIEASGLCRYFDGNGNVVPNPRNPEKAMKSSVETEWMAEERILDGLADHTKDEFGFPVPHELKADNKKDEFFESPMAKQLKDDKNKQKLDLTNPKHQYLANLTQDKFFRGLEGKAHTVPLFAVRFRDHVQEQCGSGSVVDAIVYIDRLITLPLEANNDKGAKAVKAFKEALERLPDILHEAGDHTKDWEIKRLIKKVRKTDDLNEVKKIQASQHLIGARISAVRPVSKYFDEFHSDLLKNPPADDEIPTVQADPGDVKVDENMKIEEVKRVNAQK